jgi:hypothetical protein
MSRTHSYVIPASIWDEDSDYPVADWKYEIANDDTRLGYWEWVQCRRADE